MNHPGRLPGAFGARGGNTLTSRLCPHCRDERRNAHDVHDPRVGEHVQRHLGGHAWQGLHQAVGCAHPGLDRPKGMLHRLAPLTHLLDSLENMLMLPASDPTLLAGGAACFHPTSLTSRWSSTSHSGHERRSRDVLAMSAYGLRSGRKFLAFQMEVPWKPSEALAPGSYY